MLTSKQRAYLRTKSNQMETIFQIGKSGIGDTVIQQVNDALTARELIKLRVLEASLLTAREAGEMLAEACMRNWFTRSAAVLCSFAEIRKSRFTNLKNEPRCDFRRNVQSHS